MIQVLLIRRINLKITSYLDESDQLLWISADFKQNCPMYCEMFLYETGVGISNLG
jgi:hypothetical protein